MDSSFKPTDQLSANTRAWLEDVPDRFGLDLTRLIREAFWQAWDKDRDLLPGARRDKYPLDRRALIETALYNLVSRYSGMRALERTNECKNYHHVEITCGRIVMIPAAVESYGDLVRKAIYRHALANDAQQAFEGFKRDEEPVPNNALLAVVLYGPSSAYPRQRDEATPGFVVVRFPARGFTGYGEGRLNLLQRLVDYERGQRRPAVDEPEVKPQADERES